MFIIYQVYLKFSLTRFKEICNGNASESFKLTIIATKECNSLVTQDAKTLSMETFILSFSLDCSRQTGESYGPAHFAEVTSVLRQAPRFAVA